MSRAPLWVYVEGGAKGKLEGRCRRGFRRLLESAGIKGHMPKIKACGSRKAAFDDFCIAVAKRDEAILLVDSEAPVDAAHRVDPWLHVAARPGDRWTRPVGTDAEQLHLMVEVMETWLLADPEALERYYGKGFRQNALPKRPDIEKVPKLAVYDALSRATSKTKKGAYSKGGHSFEILATIDAGKLEKRATWAARFFDTLRKHMLP